MDPVSSSQVPMVPGLNENDYFDDQAKKNLSLNGMPKSKVCGSQKKSFY